MQKRNLTDADLEAIKALMEVTIDERAVTKVEFREELRHLPNSKQRRILRQPR